MSYKSDVGLVLKNEAKDELFKLINLRKNLKINQKNELLDDLQEYCKCVTSKHTLYLFDNYRWYTEEEPIQTLHDIIIHTLKPDDYYYIIRGDNDDDNQVFGLLWENDFQLCFRRVT